MSELIIFATVSLDRRHTPSFPRVSAMSRCFPTPPGYALRENRDEANNVGQLLWESSLVQESGIKKTLEDSPRGYGG